MKKILNKLDDLLTLAGWYEIAFLARIIKWIAHSFFNCDFWLHCKDCGGSIPMDAPYIIKHCKEHKNSKTQEIKN